MISDIRLDQFAPRTTALRIAPDPARYIPSDVVVQRLRFYRGRSLTAAALTLDADNLEARFGLTCRSLMDGVVNGFGITLADQTTAPGRFTLTPGFAIGPSGQDMTLNRAVQQDLSLLPRSDETLTGTRPATTQGVGVLVIEPIRSQEARFVADIDRLNAFRRDQQLDPGAAPFMDERMVDGLLLSFVVLRPLAALATATGGRNRAGHLLIEAEAQGLDLTRYTSKGVALGLMAVDAAGRILWVSRHAAARRGGGAPHPYSRSGASTSVPPLLRQSQVDALLEELQALRKSGITPTATHLRHLPPAGVLPAPSAHPPALIPQAWVQTISPIPFGQLDAVLDAASRLAPFDLTTPVDTLHWYVPVPDKLFDPDLLVTPIEDPQFAAAQTKMGERLADALKRRNAHQAQAPAVQRPVAFTQITGFPTDPNIEAGEDSLIGPGTAETPIFAAQNQSAHQTWFAALPPDLLTEAQRRLADPATNPAAGQDAGLAPFVADLTHAIDATDDFVDFGFNRVQAEIYRLRQSIMDNEEATKLATFPVLAGIAKGSNAFAISKGLAERFKPAAGMIPLLARIQQSPEEALLHAAPAFTDPPKMTHTALFGAAGGFFAAQPLQTSGFSVLKPMMQGVSLDYSMTLALGSSALTTSVVQAASPPKPDAFVTAFNAGRALAVDELTLSGSAGKRAAIIGSDAIPGDYSDLRSMTIATRLETPASMSARISALRIKADTFAQLARLGISVTGLRVPLAAPDAATTLVAKQDFDALIAGLVAAGSNSAKLADALSNGAHALAAGGGTQTVLVTFPGLDAQMREDANVLKAMAKLRALQSPLRLDGLADLIMARKFDPEPTAPNDTSAYFSSAVVILESVIALYRVLEKRVAELRVLRDTATEVLGTLQTTVDQWKAALAQAQNALDEARQDLRAVKALRHEEQLRVTQLLDHRQGVIRDHVKIMVFARPRHLRPHAAGATSGRLLPGVYQDPLPAALAVAPDLPSDLQRMMSVLRDVPVGWFAARDRMLAGYVAPAKLDQAFHWSAQAASIRYGAGQTIRLSQTVAVYNATTRSGLPQRPSPSDRGKSMLVATQIADHYQTLSQSLLQRRGQIDLGLIARMGWGEKRQKAETDLSLNDLIEGGRETEAARAALAELDGIERVTSALYADLRRAPSAVRLVWAERLSVFDGDPILQDVAALPGWFGLDAAQRSSIASLHGWLFRRIDPGRPEAVALMSDLLQVAILLAAHGETDRILTARLTAPATVTSGDVVDLVIDRGTPSIGSLVKFTNPLGDIITGHIHDLIRDRAQVMIAPGLTVRKSLDLTTSVWVQAAQMRGQVYGR